MAKTIERKALKKGKASFMLIGKAKVTDKTFHLDNSYDSGWTDNSMYIGIDCGNGNTVFAEMRGGFFAGQEDATVLRAYDKNEKDGDGRSKQVEIAWEDRLDESLLDSVSDSSLITVGVEKDVKGKTVYKKFLSQYDAIEYLNDYLEDEVVVNVKGNLKYNEYDGNVSVKKEISSIVLSRVEDEADFKATFSQAILVDHKCIGKKDEEKGTMALDAYVIDYVGSPKIDGEKIEIKKNIVFPITLEVAINENPEITARMLQKFFKPKKKGTLNEITVVGNLIEGGSVVNITEDDIPDDIKELIEMGLYSEEEAEKKCAVGNNNREKRMVVLKPDITYVGQGDERKPTVPFDEGKYEDADLVFYAQVLEDAGVKTDNGSDSTDSASEDDDLLAMLAGM